MLRTDEYKICLNSKIRHIRKKAQIHQFEYYHLDLSVNGKYIALFKNKYTMFTNFRNSSYLHLQEIHSCGKLFGTHSNPLYTTISHLSTYIQKFTFLKSQLSNEAVRCIDGLSLTNNNYTETMKFLKERFCKQHKITNVYMQAL